MDTKGLLVTQAAMNMNIKPYIPVPKYYIGQTVFHLLYTTKPKYELCTVCKGSGKARLVGLNKALTCPICKGQKFGKTRTHLFIGSGREWEIREVKIREIQIVMLDNSVSEKVSHNYVRYLVDMPDAIPESLLFKTNKLALAELEYKKKALGVK